MIDFRKRLGTTHTQKPTNPLALYETMDRASDKGPLRPAQTAILREWYELRRCEKDIILKLHTGQGKTLIGLLILQSKLNELAEPAVYLCPNNYLIEQTCTQAKQFGIRFCTPSADGELPDDFFSGKALLITSVQKMFNGRTKFKLGQQSIPVSYVLMDDAHACIDAIRDAFTIRLEGETPAYSQLLELFSEALVAQGAGTFADIKAGNADCLLPVPYWDWQDRKEEVMDILSRMLRDESEKKSNRANIWFVWPLLKDIIHQCQCVVSGHTLEIAPYLPPLDVFGSYFRAKHRVFMSATVTNDAFLVKGLRLSPTTVKNPLAFKEERWSGEKMILLPSLMHASLDRSTMVNEIGRKWSGRNYGVVILSPSFKMTADWAKYGSVVADRDSIGAQLDNLRQGQFESPLVVVNRYDGIDLPDQMCRILVLDSMPYSESLVDRREEECRATSEITAIRTARTIEQGLGRSVRGERDFSVIIVIGSELVKFVRNLGSRKYLSSQTRSQVEIGIQIADMAEQEMKSDAPPLQVLYNLINQCLDRDDGWKEFYVQNMNKVGQETTSYDVLDLFSLELEAELLFQSGQVKKAVETIQNLIDVHVKDRDDRYWYLETIARYIYATSKTESNKHQVATHRGNRYLMKPGTGVEFTPLQVVSQRRVAAIARWVAAHEHYEQLQVEVGAITSKLDFGVKSEKFEQAFKDLGTALGFASERPDKEWKEGPDNLWCIEAGTYLLVECKNEVDIQRLEINKAESGQMNNSCAWFDRHYEGASVKRVLIIPTNRLNSAAGFVQEVEIMGEKSLRRLRNNVIAFFAEFKNADFKSISDTTIQEYLDIHHLSVDSLMNQYSEKPRQ